MLNLVILAIVLVSTQRITAQLQPNPLQFFENSIGDSSQEDGQFDDDIHYDDDVWFEIQYKPQQFLQSVDEYYYEDEEKTDVARGIPLPGSPKAVSCIEKLYGPFYTIEGMPSEEHIYPARYFNISCVRNDKLHHHDHHRQLAIKCQPNENRACITTIKEVPVFRKTPNKHNKNCWKPEKLIPVETGCKCNHVI